MIDLTFQFGIGGGGKDIGKDICNRWVVDCNIQNAI